MSFEELQKLAVPDIPEDGILRFESQFSVEHSADQSHRIREFWSRKGFGRWQTWERHLTAQRGSHLGSVFSSDVHSLTARLLIEFTDGGEVRAEMEVDVNLQFITPKRYAFFALEMLTFKDLVLYGNSHEDDWEKYKRWRSPE